MIWLPAEISRDPLHHSRRGLGPGAQTRRPGGSPDGYGATDPEKSLQEVGPFYSVLIPHQNLIFLGPFAEWSGAKLDKNLRDGPFYPARKQG